MSTNNSTIRNVVLVHGGFVDGSGWEGVSALLALVALSVPTRKALRTRPVEAIGTRE